MGVEGKGESRMRERGEKEIRRRIAKENRGGEKALRKRIKGETGERVSVKRRAVEAGV